MTQRNDDDLLREAFQDLRGDIRRRGAVPDATSMLARAREEARAENPDAAVQSAVRGGGRAWARRSAGLSFAAAAAVAALILLDGSDTQADREFERLVAAYSTDVSAGAWRSPTDALLRTPGLDLGAVPSFGATFEGLAPRPDAPRDTDPGRDS